jgi:hypothetical protein
MNMLFTMAAINGIGTHLSVGITVSYTDKMGEGFWNAQQCWHLSSKLHTILSMPHSMLQAFGGHADGVNINTIQIAMNRTAVLLC